MENNPFIVDLPIKNGDFPVMLVYEKEFHIETEQKIQLNNSINSIKSTINFH